MKMDIEALIEEVKKRNLIDALEKVGGEIEADKAKQLEELGLLVKAEEGYTPTTLFYEVLIRLKPLPSLNAYGEILEAARFGTLYDDQLGGERRKLVEELVKRGWLRIRYEPSEHVMRLAARVGAKPRGLKPLKIPRRMLLFIPFAASALLALTTASKGFPYSSAVFASIAALSLILALKGTRKVVRF